MTGKRCIISLPRSARGRLALLCSLMALILAVALLWSHGNDGLPGPSDRLLEASMGRSSVQAEMHLDAEKQLLNAVQTITYLNDTGDTLESIGMRAWLNAFETEEKSPAALEEIYDLCYAEGFSPGYITILDVKWNGEAAPWAYTNGDHTALEVEIPALQNGEEGELLIRSSAKIPHCAHRTGYSEGAYALSHAFPTLGFYENGAWRKDEYHGIGDPFVSPCVNYSLQLSLPEGYIPACSAPLEQGKDGVWRGQVLSARDVGLCVSPDYRRASCRVGDTMVYSYARDEQKARRALEDAAKALETYSRLYGRYPWPSLTVCSADFPFGGMEYAAFMLISDTNYMDMYQDSLELVIAHETAHQWFYGLVGSDQWRHPWQDEALCEYASLRYVEQRYGRDSYETLKYFRVDMPMQEHIPGTLTPGSPIDYFAGLDDYSAIVYGRGAGLLVALDEMLPGGADGFLKAYAERFAFDFVSREEFEQFLQQYAGMDMAPLLLDYLDTSFSAAITNERVIA